jgi:hypothetical protein
LNRQRLLFHERPLPPGASSEFRLEAGDSVHLEVSGVCAPVLLQVTHVPSGRSGSVEAAFHPPPTGRWFPAEIQILEMALESGTWTTLKAPLRRHPAR